MTSARPSDSIRAIRATASDLPKTFSPELTFVPRLPPHEIPHSAKGEVEIALEHINVALAMPAIGQLKLRAKLDPFHDPHNKEKCSYCIEIVPAKHWPMSYLSHESSFIKVIDVLFKGMKKIGYVPCASKRKNGVLTEYPTGGCHIHYGSALFPTDTDFYRNMEALHWLLIYEQVNNPWLRWVFAQWFNDAGHHTIFNPEIWDSFIPSPDWLFRQTSSCYTIEPRFMPTAKGSWATWEWRIFRMVENGTELVRIVRFVDAFMSHLVKRVYLGESRETCELKMDIAEWKNLSNPGVVERKFKNLLDILNMPWQDYAMFYERNFLTRLRYGKLI